jgi:orotate phosphoribosyltransferase
MDILRDDIYHLLREHVEAERFRALFRRCDAYREGHFISTSSGLHFLTYFDMQRAFQYYLICDLFALYTYKNLPESIRQSATLLAGPERGAWPLLLALAHYLPNEGIRTLSLQKKIDGGFELPRNAVIKNDDQILIVDDVFTTGKTTWKVINVFDSNPVIGAVYGVNRAPAGWDASKNLPSIPLRWVVRDPQDQFKEEDCPACLKGIEVENI